VLKLASAALAALLVLSPALASTKKHSAAPAKTCTTLDALSVKLEGVPLSVKLEGEKLGAFREKVQGLPETVDLIAVFGKKGSGNFFAVFFAKGCAVGWGAVPAALIEKPADDGSI